VGVNLSTLALVVWTRAITVVPPLMKECALGPLLAVINGKFLFNAGLSYAEQNCGKP
jgi:hypothetical protein